MFFMLCFLSSFGGPIMCGSFRLQFYNHHQQRRSNGKDKLKYAKGKPQSYWSFVKSVVTYARSTDKIQGKKAVKKCYKGEELGSEKG